VAIGDIVVSIRADARSFSAATRSARQSSSQFRSTVTRNNRSAATSFQTLERAVFRARARMIGLRAVAGGVFTFLGGGSVLRFADEWRLAENRIAVVSDSLEVAKEDMKDLLDLANRSRGSINNLANTYTKLRLSRDEFDKDTTVRLLETVQKSLVIGGNSQQETRSVITQLVQGIAADQLGGEELRAIRESGFFLQKVLADGLGVTVGELKELGAESKLTAKAITEALLEMSDEVDLVFNSIPPTIGQATTVLNNQFREWVASADTASGATQTIASSIALLGNNLGSVLDTTILVGASAATLALTRSTGILTQALIVRTAQSARSAAATRARALADQTAASTASIAAAADARSARAAFNTSLQNLRNARSADERTRAHLRLVQTTRAVTFADTQAAAAATRLTSANIAVARSSRAASAASGLLRGTLAFFGGPIGLGITAIAAGFALWANNARKAKERTAELLSTTEQVLSIADSFNSGNNFFTAASRADTIDKLTGSIEVFEDRITRAQSRLEALTVTQQGFTRTLDRGNNTRTQVVPGRSLNEDELKEQERALQELKIATEGLETAQKSLDDVTNTASISNEAYLAKQKELREELNKTGSVFKEKTPERYTDAIEKLTNSVSVAKSELEAYRNGTEGAGEAQRVINGLVSNGVSVSGAMADKIRSLTADVAEYKNTLKREESVANVFEDLQGDVVKARADLNSLGATGSTGGLNNALEAIQKLRSEGVDVSGISGQIRALGTEYDSLRDRITAANDNQKAFEERLESARSLAEELRTPLEQYRGTLAEINSLQQEFPDVLSQVAAEQARTDAAMEYLDAIREARAEQLKFSEDLASGILRADSLGDALRNVGQTIQNKIVDRLLLEPLTDIIDQGITFLGNSIGGLLGGAFGGIDPVEQAAKAANTAAITANTVAATTNTASQTAAAATQTASLTASTASYTANSAVVVTGTAALTALTASATAASAALTAAAASASVNGTSGILSGFAGFFADGGTIPLGQFGVVGEAGPELISAASGPLTVTPLGKLPNTNPGRVSSGASVTIQNSYTLSGVDTREMVAYIDSKSRETERRVPSLVSQYEFDRGRGAA